MLDLDKSKEKKAGKQLDGGILDAKGFEHYPMANEETIQWIQARWENAF